MSTSHHHSNGHQNLSIDEQSVKKPLDQYLKTEVDNLDFNVTSKLAGARHRALDQSPIRNRHWGAWQKMAGGGAALAVALVVGQQMYNPTSEITAPDTTSVAQSGLMEDLPLLASGDDLEFYQSIEFLEWLENNS